MTDLASLLARHCEPRRGPADAIAPADAARLLRLLPGWEAEPAGDAIVRTFRFADYHHTMAFVNAVASVAHREDHHPDLEVHYDRCRVRYSTHDVGGLSLNDFICAARVEDLHAGS